MSTSFPYHKALIDGSEIEYPYIHANVKTANSVRQFSFLVDTGADMSLMPFYMTIVLGISTKKLTLSQSLGISSQKLQSFETSIEIQIGSIWITIPCTLLKDSNAPFLLGRQGVFSYFSILFDNKNKKTVFTPI